MRFTVIGAGRWGTFLAWYAHRLGHTVGLFGRSSSPRFQTLVSTRTNGLVTLAPGVELITALSRDTDVFFISVSSQTLRGLLQEHAALPAWQTRRALHEGPGNRQRRKACPRSRARSLGLSSPWRCGLGRATCRSLRAACPTAW